MFFFYKMQFLNFIFLKFRNKEFEYQTFSIIDLFWIINIF